MSSQRPGLTSVILIDALRDSPKTRSVNYEKKPLQLTDFTAHLHQIAATTLILIIAFPLQIVASSFPTMLWAAL